MKINTAANIPAAMLQGHQSIYGRVVKVSDGDTFRMRHYPFYPAQQESPYEGKLSENTIQIRLYGIDTPEVRKSGNPYPSMPYAEEAKAWTTDKVKGKIVQVKLLDKDQYNRVIGKVTTVNDFLQPMDVSLGLLHNGYATLYTGKGAQYDGNLEVFEKEVEYAQKNRLGIWTNGIDGVQTPAEYKRMLKEQQKMDQASKDFQ